jgi:aminoglycoside phosphotransferase (APT) family kinase protein
MSAIDKNRPSDEWIAYVRRTLPCEREIDRILTRKLLRRAGAQYTTVSLDQLVSGVHALLRKNLAAEFRVFDAQWMTGGASKLQMSFLLDWQSPDIGRTVTPLVLRMEPAASVVETSRLREFQIIKALAGIIPVAPAYWVDTDGEFLPYPAIVCGFVTGVTKPTGGSAGVSGTGAIFSPATAKALGAEFIRHMAAMHRFDWRSAALDAFDIPSPASQSVDWQINWWERVWEEDSHEDVPLLRLAASWLRQNRPTVDTLSLVHGDIRTGNFLYDESSNRITAFLDWETAHIGDRHEDIVYMTNAPYRVFAPDGKTSLLGGLMPEEALYEAYEKASGLTVVPQMVNFYKVLNSLKVAAVTLAASYRAARCGKTHQDVLVAWVIGIAYVVMDDLRLTFEEVL